MDGLQSRNAVLSNKDEMVLLVDNHVLSFMVLSSFEFVYDDFALLGEKDFDLFLGKVRPFDQTTS